MPDGFGLLIRRLSPSAVTFGTFGPISHVPYFSARPAGSGFRSSLRLTYQARERSKSCDLKPSRRGVSCTGQVWFLAHGDRQAHGAGVRAENETARVSTPAQFRRFPQARFRLVEFSSLLVCEAQHVPSTGILGVDLEGCHQAVGCLLHIAENVVQRSQIGPRFLLVRLDFQCGAVGGYRIANFLFVLALRLLD